MPPRVHIYHLIGPLSLLVKGPEVIGGDRDAGEEPP